MKSKRKLIWRYLMMKVPFFSLSHPWQKTNLQFLFLFLVVSFSATSVSAQTWYIKPSSEIPLRRGQGTDYRILAIVPDGTAVTIEEENDTWAKVTTEGGKDGWILKRYLTQDPPLQKAFNRIQQENTVLKEKIAELDSKNTEFKDFDTALKNTLKQTKKELAATNDKYQQLLLDTADVIAIKNNLDQSRAALAKLQKEFGSVTAENNRLKASQNIKWFLAGGGTLIFGLIIGLTSSRSKRKRSSLY